MQHGAHPRWQNPDARSADRRGATRHDHFEHVVVRTEWGDHRGALLDLSSAGGQVRISNGLVPFAGDEITLRLVDAQHLCGQVAWVGDTSFGVVFDHPIANLGCLLWPEQRGPEWFRSATHQRM